MLVCLKVAGRISAGMLCVREDAAGEQLRWGNPGVLTWGFQKTEEKEIKRLKREGCRLLESADPLALN